MRFPALIAFHLRDMVRDPVLLAGVAGVVALSVVSSWTEMTVWPRALADMGVGALANGCVMLVVFNLKVLRDRALGLEGILQSTPTTELTRYTAQLAAALMAAFAVGATSVGLQVAGLFWGSTPVGSLAAAELVGQIIAVMVLAAVGIVLGWLSRRPFLGVITAVLVFLALMQLSGNWRFIVVPNVVPGVATRPPSWHFYYSGVLLVAVVAAGLALRFRLRIAAVIALISIAAGATVGARLGDAQKRADPYRDNRDVNTASAATVCESRNQVRYCAIPSFETWIPLWAAAVDPIVAVAPTPGADGYPPVLQTLPIGTTDTGEFANAINVPIEWGRNGGQKQYRIHLAGQLAAFLVGLPYGNTTGGVYGCSGVGQARVVLALWLVGHVEQPGAAELSDTYVEDDRGTRKNAKTADSALGAIYYSAADLELANRIPRDQATAELLRKSWSELVKPDTASNELAALTGQKYRPARASSPIEERCG